MVILDSAIVIVALPSIESDLGFSALLGGRAADLLGANQLNSKEVL